MIHIGTSGFSYDDWAGPFYPAGIPKSKMFESYREWFGAVEINSTYYGIPSPETMRALVRRAAGRVLFTAKMNDQATHKGSLDGAWVAKYCRAMEPMAEAGALKAVLFQFPFRFHNTPENRTYLARALDLFNMYSPVVEIRHDSWQSEEGLDFFRRRRISLCITDMPNLRGLPRTLPELTGPIAYVRFHGRNGKHWFEDAGSALPYDYDYSEEELRAWVAPLKQLNRKAETTFAFFNNHIQAQAPHNAQVLADLMEGRNPTPRNDDLFGA